MKPHLMLGASAIALFAMIAPALAATETGTITSINENRQILTLNGDRQFKISTLLNLKNYKVGERVQIEWSQYEDNYPRAGAITVLPAQHAPMNNMEGK